MHDLIIRNGKLVTAAGIIDGDCLISAGRIDAVRSAGEVEPATALRTIDGTGLFVAPGLIDLQLNGGFGSDFTREPASIWRVAAALPHGA